MKKKKAFKKILHGTDDMIKFSLIILFSNKFSFEDFTYLL